MSNPDPSWLSCAMTSLAAAMLVIVACIAPGFLTAFAAVLWSDAAVHAWRLRDRPQRRELPQARARLLR